MSHNAEQDTVREEEENLSASVERGPRSHAVLTVLRGDNPGFLFTLEGAESVVGRSPDVEVTLPDESLSRRHARIRRSGEAFTIEDLGSTNGTFVDGKRVEGPQALEDGARIFLGTRTVLHFRLHDGVELEAARQTRALTVRDPLTGCFNRRHLQDCLWAEAAYAQRHRAPLSLILLDIDHFKRINDEFGHAAGDAALCMVAETIESLTRREDLLARFGGEEFAVLARGIDREATRVLAERIRGGVAAQKLSTSSGTLSCTVSLGVAHSADGSDADPQELFEAADRALYEAKDTGRNRVSLAPPGD
ncbi:MAG: GGDEF domain-containing protein [Myxococcales bacterium]